MLELQGHTGRVRTIAYAPDGRTLASGGDDFSIRLWDIPSGECRHTITEHTESVRALAFTPDGTALVSGGWDDRVLLHPLSGRRKVKILPGSHLGGVYSLTFHPQNSNLAAGDGDGTVSLFINFQTKQPFRHPVHAYPVTALAWSPNGKTLATVSLDHTLKLWDGDWMQPRLTYHGLTWLRCLAWSPSGTHLALGDDDGRIHLFDATGRQATKPLRGHTARISSVYFSEDGSRLISAGWDGTLRTWAIPEGRLLDARDWGLGRVGTLALSPDRMTAAAGMENTVLVWDTDGSGI